jgi:PTS system nitrogen regulatory IIA component
MTIGELIGVDHVIVGLRVGDKTQLLQELARRASAVLSLDQRMILDALLAREDLGSTGIGKGFALPHARLDALSRFFALFVRLARPIDFASIDGLSVDLVYPVAVSRECRQSASGNACDIVATIAQ